MTVIFEPNLPLADMKARLVLNRLSTKARILCDRPARGAARRGRSLTRFTVFLATDCDADELRGLADVEGVAEVRLESASTPRPHCERSRGRVGTPASQSRDSQPEAATARGHLPRPTACGTGRRRSRGDRRRARRRRQPPPRRMRPSASRPAAKPAAGRGKAKVAETIRVDSDRLDHLMNLAGELVITKARFVAIARGLEELFRGSNAHALASDTRERLESITRGLDGLAEIKSGSSGDSAGPLVGSRPPAAR